MGLATLLKKLGSDHGIEVDDEELEGLGLSDDDEVEVLTDDALSEVLSGEAAGAVEIFLSDPRSSLADSKAIESADGLMWEPIIREGQWAVRPGANGQKRRRPLKVVAGSSKDQRKEIGLADIVAAFDDGAIEHVTVPTSHDNKVTENTGFIKGLKIVQGKVKDAATKRDKTVAVLMGAYDIRKAHIKESMNDGSIASRSAGLLYDYVNTETGKTYPVALEHVALTNKPWITGMKAFGRKLIKPLKPAIVGLSLSDDEPADEDLLAQDVVLDSIELATTEVTWDQEDDPDWLREQTNNVLRASRAAKEAALPAGTYAYDRFPNYRCVKARPGLALVSDDWGDNANFWTVPISVKDGAVEVETDLENWKASKKVFVPDDDRKDFPPGREPLADDAQAEPEPELTGLALAQHLRRQRGLQIDIDPNEDEPTGSSDKTTHPRGGEHMSETSGTLQLSEEAQKIVRDAEARAKAAEDKTERLSQQVAMLLGDRTVTRADAFVEHLKKIGLSEENGFSGALAEIRTIMSEDDGGPAVQSDKFSTDENKEGTLSLSDSIERIFKAIELSEEGKIKFGSTVAQPSEPADETKLGDDGKPKPKDDDEPEFASLSEDEQAAKLLSDNPDMAALLRLAVPGLPEGDSKNGSSQKGGE